MTTSQWPGTWWCFMCGNWRTIIAQCNRCHKPVCSDPDCHSALDNKCLVPEHMIEEAMDA